MNPSCRIINPDRILLIFGNYFFCADFFSAAIRPGFAYRVFQPAESIAAYSDKTGDPCMGFYLIGKIGSGFLLTSIFYLI
jgi:hypothetical protein